MSGKIVNVMAVLVLVVLSLAILGNSMTKSIGRDEQMYCTAPVLLAQGKMIYRDFSYAAQLPYHPLLYAAIFRISGTNHYLFVGRMVSVVCDILVMVCIVGIYRRSFKSFAISGMLFGLAGAVLYVFNPLVDYANGYAWNHDVVILCVVLSFLLFVSIDFKRKARYWRIGAIGALLTFATCMRITTALVELLFFAVLLAQPAASIKQRFKNALPFLIAAACVLAWPIWVIAQAPRAFFLNLVKIPTLYGEWLGEIGMVHSKYALTLWSITRPGYLVLLLLVIYVWLMMVFFGRRLKISNGRNVMLAALLPVTFFVIAFIPPTMWRQYLAMPVPFLIIGAAYPLLGLRKLANKTGVHTHFKIACSIATVCVIVAVGSYPVVLSRTPVLFVPERWEPIRLHKISEDIAERTKEPKLILTLVPLLALEGGCDIYSELSCGAIIYRVGDSLSESDRQRTHTTGVETLAGLLEKKPPSAVILGMERGRLAFLEGPLQRAVKDEWEQKAYENGPVVYFRD